MKKAKGAAALLLALVMAGTLFACGTPKKDTGASAQAPAEKTTVNVLGLKGPSGIGLVKLMEEQEQGNAANNYQFSVAAAPTDAVAALSNGSADIAAVPPNVAATLYQKTNGNVQMLAINTLGVLYLLDGSDFVHSVADLRGKTIVASGQGAAPEYVLNYILQANGLEPGKDVTIEYKGEHAEVAALASSGQAALTMLPEPNVTSVTMKNSKVKAALDLTKEWEKACEKNGTPSKLAMGCLVVRKEFAQQNPAAVNTFLDEYKQSVAYVTGEATMDAAAQLVEKYGIMPNAAAARKAIPQCNIVMLEGDEMKRDASENLTVLFKANPASVGGALPDDAFYYSR